MSHLHKFWETIAFSVTKYKELLLLCDSIMARKKAVKRLFAALRALKELNPVTEALDCFYHTVVICYPFKAREESALRKVH